MPVPDVIGRYRVRKRLGSGAFATVWLAIDEALDSPVAVKVLAENWADHADVRTRFTQEAQIMRRADSDRLVRVFDVGELPDGRPYLVMTYAAGGTLADLLADGPLPVDVAVRTTTEIARGIAVLHAAGVIHRDLKPSNILFRDVQREAPQAAERPSILIADLGLAKAIAHASGFTIVAGSPGYMAPEQTVPGGGIDVRADVYAIGALAYHMLTGGPPRDGRTRPSAERPGIPAAIDTVVHRALRRRREDRYPSAAALAAALASTMDAKHRRPSVARVVLSLAAVGAAAMVSAGSAASADMGLVRVHDASGRISIAVPASWAKQYRDAGWNPGRLGLPQGLAPGLVIGPDLAAWADPASGVPGMFVGLTPPLATGNPTGSPAAAPTGSPTAKRTGNPAGNGTGKPTANPTGSPTAKPIGNGTEDGMGNGFEDHTGGSLPALPDHPGCVRQPGRRAHLVGFDARVQRWTRCAGTSISYSEVLLVPPHWDFGVYVQVKQVGGADRTDRLLDRLQIY